MQQYRGESSEPASSPIPRDHLGSHPATQATVCPPRDWDAALGSPRWVWQRGHPRAQTPLPHSIHHRDGKQRPDPAAPRRSRTPRRPRSHQLRPPDGSALGRCAGLRRAVSRCRLPSSGTASLQRRDEARPGPEPGAACPEGAQVCLGDTAQPRSRSVGSAPAQTGSVRSGPTVLGGEQRD